MYEEICPLPTVNVTPEETVNHNQCCASSTVNTENIETLCKTKMSLLGSKAIKLYFIETCISNEAI